MVSKFEFSKYHAAGTSFTMDKAALEILRAATTGSGLAVAHAAIDSLEKMDPDSNAVKLFDSQGSSNKHGNFQLLPCDMAPNGDVTLGLGTFHFQADRQVTQFLWFKWSTMDVNFYRGAQSVVFNEQVYSKVRQLIKDKLGDMAIITFHWIEYSGLRLGLDLDIA